MQSEDLFGDSSPALGKPATKEREVDPPTRRSNASRKVSAQHQKIFRKDDRVHHLEDEIRTLNEKVDTPTVSTITECN